MYATETYVRQEAKEVHAMVKDMANELGGDIRYLHQEIQQLSERLSLLEEQIRLVREENQ
jgi:prefoldin subunit 5|tara:strand:- start:521 stop:700 length:180 start_codon:yes stop_codon:yes gene_type:complete